MQVNVPKGNFSQVAGRELELVQWHFHTPSEHAFDGNRKSIEAHLVHKDTKTGEVPPYNSTALLLWAYHIHMSRQQIETKCWRKCRDINTRCLCCVETSWLGWAFRQQNCVIAHLHVQIGLKQA